MPPVQTTNEENEEVPAEETTGGEAPAEGTPAAEPEEQIEIAGKTFATQAEALAYAQSALRDSEHQRSLVEAYNAGLVERGGAQAPVAQSAPQAPENWEEKFYANPKATLAEYAEQIRKEVLGNVTAQTEDQKMWAEFNRRHPDLDGFGDDVSAVLAKHDKEIRALASTKGKETAMDYLAQKTRAKFEEYAERKKPKRELPNSAPSGLPSGQTQVTKINAQKSEKPLSFVEQVRQNKLKRM